MSGVPGRVIAAAAITISSCAAPSSSPTTTVAATTTSTTAVTTTTTAPPPPTTTTRPEPVERRRGRLVIHAVGDVGFDVVQYRGFLQTGFDRPWYGARGIFRRDSLTIVNLECAPSDLGSPLAKAWTFRCSLAALEPMRRAGVDVASLANNHSGDFGLDALVDGRRRLLEAEIQPVGAGEDLAEANRPAVFDLDGWRVAVVGFTSVSRWSLPLHGDPESGETADPWFARSDRPGAAPATIENITAAVGEAARIADIVIVTVHWGIELAPNPSNIDRERAKAMIAAGADVIVGHHPHRLQPFEMVDGVPVFWSMGSWIWPDLRTVSAPTGIAEIVVEPDGTIQTRMIPAFIEDHAHPILLGEPDPSLTPERPGIE